MKRPALWFFVSLAAGIAAVKIDIKFAVFIVFISFAIGAVLAKKKTHAAFIIPVAAVAGTLLMGAFLYGQKDVSNITAIKGVVKDAQIMYSKRQTLTVDTSEVFKNGAFEKDNIIFKVYTNPEVYVKRNDTCIFSGNVQEGYSNIDGIMFANKIYYCGHNKGGLFEIIYKLRDKISDSADRLFPENEAGTIKALVTGKTVFINPSTKQLYSAAGISHILAVSGLHTALIAAMFLFVLKLLKINARKRTVFVMAFLVLYGIFIGGRAPCIRAIIMLETVLFGQLIYKRNDGINSLAFAGILILLFQPYELFQAGFQLSFMSVFSLFILGKLFKPINGFWGNIFDIVLASLFITVFTFPILAYHFYGFSVYGFITNLLVIPSAGFLVGFAMLSCIGGIISHAVGMFFAGPAYFILKCMEYACEFVSSLPYNIVQTGKLPIMFIALYYLGLMTPVMIRNVRKQAIFIAADIFAVFCVLFSNRLIFKENTYYFLSERKGQSEIISSYDGHVYIIGGREYNSRTDYAGKTSDFLLSMGKTKADAVFVTDSEKCDFILNLMNHIKIGTIIMPYNCDDDDVSAIEYKANENGAKVIKAVCAKKAKLGGGIEVTCLYPTGNETDKTGHAVYMIKDKDFDFIDITSADENEEKLIEAVPEDKCKAIVVKNKDYVKNKLVFDGSDDIKMRGDKTWVLPQ
ncbi:MAG: ComEC/Rec2 family competence protein [Clostridia bacterium]|jgi:competence protein ComEC|nr:ComEC/Rec2 family competence protein [Clostridia bacterium]